MAFKLSFCMLDNQSTNYIIDINEQNFKLQNITEKATRNINIKVWKFSFRASFCIFDK